MKQSHAVQAGKSTAYWAHKSHQARDAERFVARIFHGLMRDDPYDQVGDVLLPPEVWRRYVPDAVEGIVNVKLVSGPLFVNAGDRKPLTHVIVVRHHVDGFVLVGQVPVERWTFGAPFDAPNAIPCWHVLASGVDPIDDPRDAPSDARTDEVVEPTLGLDVQPAVAPQPAPELDAVENRRAQWREAGARRRARWRNAPIGWAYPDDPPRGLGDNPGTGRRAVRRGS